MPLQLAALLSAVAAEAVVHLPLQELAEGRLLRRTVVQLLRPPRVLLALWAAPVLWAARVRALEATRAMQAIQAMQAPKMT